MPFHAPRFRVLLFWSSAVARIGAGPQKLLIIERGDQSLFLGALEY